MRSLLVALLAAGALLGAPQPAHALSPDAARAFADRVARHWAANQLPSGFFVDTVSGRRQGGYGNIMIGYALLRASVRAHDQALLRAGLRGVSTALTKTPAERGVFDLLSFSAAYRFARAQLPRDPEFRQVRSSWERYLRTTGQPNMEGAAKGCVLDPNCFHNHEAVGAAGDLELLATGLSSSTPGAKLADRRALRAEALGVVGVVEPRFAGGQAFVTGPHAISGLGLLSDSGTFPLAYHSLSTLMLAHSIELLGRSAPRASVDALARTIGATAGFMGPDGDVAYLGRRQEQSWALAAAVAGGEIGASLLRSRGGTAPALHSVANRAFARLVRLHGLTPAGVRIVPRRGRGAHRRAGIDVSTIAFNGLTVYFLNLAADAAATSRSSSTAALTADRSGGFLDPDQAGLAAVRHGDVWYAVHRRRTSLDARYDFGLIALKLRGRNGAWRDVLRPRPKGGQTAGPVIFTREGIRLLPYGDTISLGKGGRVIVRGRFEPGNEVKRARSDAFRFARSATWRFTPLARGAKVSFRARRGDRVVLTTYLPAGRAHSNGASVWDSASRATTRPRPAQIRWRRGFASCCDARLVAADMVVRPRRSGVVTYSVRASRIARPARSAHGKDGGKGWLLAAPVGAGVVLALALTRRRLRRR